MLKLISSILALCPLWMYSQSSAWQEITPDCQEATYYVQYVSDNNHMIIGIPYLYESYITTDHGQSFQRFPWTYARFLVEIQSEMGTDDFYFTDGKLIYKYEKQTEAAVVVHDNSAYGSVQRGVLLSNGEKLIIYYESDKLMIGRFDTDGELLISNVLSEESARVELLYQEGYPSYITKSTYGRVVKTILSFDPDDLSLGNEFEIDASSTGMRYQKGRLFASNEFSDDGGLTWSKINSPEDVRWGTSIDILDDQVIVLANNHILYSTDYGETFTVKSHNLESASFMTISFDNDGQRLMLYNSSSFDVFYSDDLGSSWSTYNNALPLSHATRIASLQDDNLVTNTIGCTGRYWTDNEWNDTRISDNSFIWDFAGLQNGNYAGLNAGNIYLSQDKGATWELTEPDFYESRLSTKEGVVFVTGYSGVAISENNGESYTRYDMNAIPGLWGSSHFSDLSTLYYNSNYELSTYDFVSETNVSLQRTIDPSTHVDLETDWSGKGFYLLEYESASQEQLVIVRSSGPGSSFDRKSIPITPDGSDYRMETDHNGNVFVYNVNQIMISQDQGDSWHDITPVKSDLWLISDMTVSFDNYLYVSTVGSGVLKFPCKIDTDIEDCEAAPAGGEDVSLKIYPNPARNTLTFASSKAFTSESRLRIMDLSGRIVHQANLAEGDNEQSINIEPLSQGIFLLYYENEYDSKVERFTKK